MTFELQVRHGIRVTLVDPRPFKLSRAQVKELQAQGCSYPEVLVLEGEGLQQGVGWEAAREVAATAQGRGAAAATAGAGGGSSVAIADTAGVADAGNADGGFGVSSYEAETDGLHHGMFEDVVWTSNGDLAEHEGAVAAAEAAAGEQNEAAIAPDGSKAAGGASGIIDGGTFRQIQALFDEQLWSSSHGQNLLGSCSLVLGMHPDQATEPILQYSMATGKPFAIVPCCVFPRLFPTRRFVDEDGESKSVVGYAELVEYLLQKAGAGGGGGEGVEQLHRGNGVPRKATLGFEGANQVVFRISVTAMSSALCDGAYS